MTAWPQASAPLDHLDLVGALVDGQQRAPRLRAPEVFGIERGEEARAQWGS